MTTETLPLTTIPWMAVAACRGADPDLFFLAREDGGPGGPGEYTEARAICRRCDVRADCRDYAVKHRVPWGMWGGLTPRERLELRR